VYVQAPNTADLRGSGACGQHPLGASWNIASRLDPLLFLHMERCQMDRQSESSDSFDLLFCTPINRQYIFSGI
jgi:hypothetical protein